LIAGGSVVLDVAVALVTGGGRGIGRGISLALAHSGFGVAINYHRSREGAEQTRGDCLAAGAPWAAAFPADVGNGEEHRRLVGEMLEQTGRIDVLVNNAGISSPVRGDILDVTPENWETVMSTNLAGPFFLTQLVAREMIALRRENRIERGTIVNISSVSAYVASTARSEYCISKAGLAMLTQLYAHRLADDGIYVYEIRPGIIRSDMTRPAIEKYDKLIAQGLTPIRRWGEPEDVGAAVAVLARGLLPFTTGQVLDIDGGFHLRHL
jgi:NAD(P)-dependent dehydrogenase (short-subunit alcohol dehydrogenase family)